MGSKGTSKYIGTRFGKLVVTDIKRIENKSYFVCKCDCGNIVEKRVDTLKQGKISSCGCIPTKASDVNIGSKRGYLEVIDRQQNLLTLKCNKCGKVFDQTVYDFTTSDKITCGCGAKVGITLSEKECAMCGKKIMAYPKQKYCKDCAEIKRKEANRISHQRIRNHTNIQLGITKGTCEVCGKEFIYNSARQKYCADCKAEAIQKAGQKISLDNYYQKRDEKNEKRNNKRQLIK